ncbi:MAG: hypothetical protein V9G98_00725 [Candidatus Competibacter sp.]
MVALGVVFAITGTFVLLDAVGFDPQRLGIAGHRHRARHVGGRRGGAGGGHVLPHGARHGRFGRGAGIDRRGRLAGVRVGRRPPSPLSCR